MSDAMRNQLEQAYNLIQTDRLDDAVSLLRPIVRADPNNPDAWWLLANAVSDPNDAFEALNNVLRLEPDHEQAHDLLDNLTQEYPELASRTARPSDANTTSSVLSSSPNIAATPSDTGGFDAGWDTQFGETTDTAFSSTDTSAVSPNTDIDDFFSTLDPSAAAVSDFDSAATTFASDFAEDAFAQSSSGLKQTTEADLDSLFNTDDADNDDAEDMDTLFAQGRHDLETTDEISADNDLDAMFATGTSTASGRDSSDNALQDPFGSAEPDFLQDIEAAPAAVPAEQGRGRGVASNKVSTRTSGAIPAQDPFAAEAKINKGGRSRNLLIGLAAIVILAGVLVALALLRPFSTPSDTSATATAVLGLSTGQIDTAATVQQVLASASFPDAKVTLADNKLSVSVCEKPSRNLRTRFYTAVDTLANTTVVISKLVTNAELELVDCAQSNARLYRATAPVSALVDYISNKDVAKYHAAWVQN